ncbi:MAG: SelT/SelW/SelH family protein [Phycisphaerales bacterium]|nr:SelT/SelW/SelH family protein [Phycisphaerales bacterium]
MPRAAGLADEIKKRFKVNAELIESSGGVFEVTVNGRLVYSKAKTGEFPDNAKLLKELEAHK